MFSISMSSLTLKEQHYLAFKLNAVDIYLDFTEKARAEWGS